MEKVPAAVAQVLCNIAAKGDYSGPENGKRPHLFPVKRERKCLPGVVRLPCER